MRTEEEEEAFASLEELRKQAEQELKGDESSSKLFKQGTEQLQQGQKSGDVGTAFAGIALLLGALVRILYLLATSTS